MKRMKRGTFTSLSLLVLGKRYGKSRASCVHIWTWHRAAPHDLRGPMADDNHPVSLCGINIEYSKLNKTPDLDIDCPVCLAAAKRLGIDLEGVG